MTRIARALDAALEDLHRVDAVLSERLAAMRLASSAWPPSGSGDLTTRGGLVHWCWSHEREVERCHRDGEACAGEPLATGGDPTGEAAMSPDRARHDHQLVERRVQAIRRQADELVVLMARYALREPTVAERRATLSASERSCAAFECWSCARVVGSNGSPVFSPAARHVAVQGEPRLLCEWCRAWFRSVGELPSLAAVRDHHRGVRVRRPEPRAS